ncbi:MAG: tail fiber domain-containing protein, partial [Patescibacteria group bacterium]
YGTASGGTTNYAGYFNGNVYVSGSSTTTADLQVQGTLFGSNYTSAGLLKIGATTTPAIDNTYNLGSSALRWRNVFSNNGTIQTSDIRLKNNVVNLSYGLAEVLKLKPITYNWQNDSETRLGFIAQDVDQLIPEVVYKGDWWGINYEMIIPVLTKAIQEQQKQIEILQNGSTSPINGSTSADSSLITDPASTQRGEPALNQLGLVVEDNSNQNFQTLTVQQAATFYGTITVVGEADFESKVVFKKDVEIQGKLYVSEDQAGTAVLSAGATSTEVKFKGAYEVAPKIIVTPQSRLSGRDFWIFEKSTSTFRLSIEPIADFDIIFDWIAMPVKGEVAGAQETMAVIPGCRDASAVNYNPSANQDDGSCQYANQPTPPEPIPGCRDASAINYNPNANTDDGSCVYPPVEPAPALEPTPTEPTPAPTPDPAPTPIVETPAPTVETPPATEPTP